jgi:hypothetical protein
MANFFFNCLNSLVSLDISFKHLVNDSSSDGVDVPCPLHRTRRSESTRKTYPTNEFLISKYCLISKTGPKCRRVESCWDGGR